MPPLFYLSYARADSQREYLERFFFDLSDSVRIRLRLRLSQQVAFYDRESRDSNVQWIGPLADALRNSKALVCLTSPSVFSSERCGREWQLFQDRIDSHSAESPSAKYAIIPVPWVPSMEMPRIVSRAFQAIFGAEFATVGEVGVLRMLQSPKEYRDEYLRLTDFLAELVVSAVNEIDLPPLENLPRQEDVQNAFLVNQTAGTPAGGMVEPTDKFKVVIVDNEEAVRDLLVEVAIFADFDAVGFAEGEKALYEILNDHSAGELPDLIVIDLELEPGKMQGMELIASLVRKNIYSSILAVSGNRTPNGLLNAFEVGASDTESKPFELDQFTNKMRRLASIGRKRRLHRESGDLTLTDLTRIHRPVFLSHFHEDMYKANGLRVKIEDLGIPVWYAPITLEPGREWLTMLKRGIDEARMFMALITEDYLQSKTCVAEFSRFYDRLTSDNTENPPCFLSVLYGDPSMLDLNPLIKRQIKKYQWITVTPNTIVDAYTEILLTVQRCLNAGSDRRPSWPFTPRRF